MKVQEIFQKKLLNEAKISNNKKIQKAAKDVTFRVKNYSKINTLRINNSFQAVQDSVSLTTFFSTTSVRWGHCLLNKTAMHGKLAGDHKDQFIHLWTHLERLNTFLCLEPQIPPTHFQLPTRILIFSKSLNISEGQLDRCNIFATIHPSIPSLTIKIIWPIT